jgi:hypothetical protein
MHVQMQDVSSDDDAQHLSLLNSLISDPTEEGTASG